MRVTASLKWTCQGQQLHQLLLHQSMVIGEFGARGQAVVSHAAEGLSQERENVTRLGRLMLILKELLGLYYKIILFEIKE